MLLFFFILVVNLDTQQQYYLASAFDKVYMQPSGSIPLVGLSSTVPFFKTLLGRFGILGNLSHIRNNDWDRISQCLT